MILISEKQNCCGCKACYNICPKSCIEMISDDEGFWYPTIDGAKCVQCGLCEKTCPQLNVFSNGRVRDKPVCAASWNNDKSIRKESSSGGVFTAIAQWILSDNGVVFGAGYDGDFNVVHKETQTLAGLKNLIGSKYVQSDTNDTYKKAQQFLTNGDKVLFTGTPCQIAGLYNFLQREYEDLYTCDLVCHGVPSPRVFESYKKNMEEKYGSSIQKISFRNKHYGWKLFSVSLQFNNSKKYRKKLTEDVFMQGFLRNYYLRPSCYKCIYAKLPRVSDITLGDFWGIADKYPQLDDDKGISLLLVNTEKGKQMLDGCAASISKKECDLDYAILNNPCIVRPVSIVPLLRKNFFEDFNTNDFDYMINKYMSAPSWIQRTIIFVRRSIITVKRKLIGSK